MLLRIIVWKMMAAAEMAVPAVSSTIKRGKKNHETDEAAQTGQHAPTAGALDFE